MQKRWIVLVVVAVLGVLLYLKVGRGGRASGKAGAATAPHAGAGAGTAGAQARTGHALSDPRTLARASFAGTVTVKGGGPIAGAQVCTTWSDDHLDSAATAEPACTTTDAAGAYRLADLVPAYHEPSASAPRHIPRAWRPPPGTKDTFRLAAGQHRTGVDFVLDPGGVEISGVVEDVSGGPIAGARVRLDGGGWWSRTGAAFTRADAQGKFTLWAKPGEVDVLASADGYANGGVTVVAATVKALVLLTPESVLAGIVVETGTRTPVPGAMVSVGGDWRFGDGGEGKTARTDDAGRFRITNLKPGRYKPRARAQGRYGEPAESVLLGLGQSAEDVTIEVHPAATVRGQVMIVTGDQREPCKRGHVSLNDEAANRSTGNGTEDDGTVELEAVLRGKYQVNVWCEDRLARDKYDPVVVATADIDGLVWEVGAGGTLRGLVKTSDGEPVTDAYVSARVTGGAARAQRSYGGDRTTDAGRFELTGLVDGDYTLDVYAEDERNPDPRPKATVKGGTSSELEIVLPSGGTIAGTVSDDDGKPVSGVGVRIANDGWNGNTVRSGDDGQFELKKVRPGERRVVASRGWWDAMKKPGSSDDDVQGERVTVVAGKTATVKLVVESRSGVITGTVTDSAGKAVVDAWVTASRESERAGAAAGDAARESRWSWGSDERPVITGTDGSFTVRELSPGTYAVRAYRRGGGEAVTEHVALGSRTTLVIRDTGTIAGTVSAGGVPPEEVTISVEDEKQGISRTERFFRTGGVFAMHDLPAGDFIVSADATGGRTSTKLSLTHGEQKLGVKLVLEGKVTLRGRIVDLVTGAPVAGLRAHAHPVKGGGGIMFSDDGGEKQDISGDDGRFELEQAPTGKIIVGGFPMDWRESPYGWMQHLVVVPAGVKEFDVGDVKVARRRMKPDQPEGDLGFTFTEGQPDQEPEDYVMKVAYVRPRGPAATAGLKVGDVIITIDGHDAKGAAAMSVWPLMDVPEGTKVTFGLERGDTLTITAGPPV